MGPEDLEVGVGVGAAAAAARAWNELCVVCFYLHVHKGVVDKTKIKPGCRRDLGGCELDGWT